MRFIDLGYGTALVLAFGGALGTSCGSGSTRSAPTFDPGGGGTGKGGGAGEEPGGSGGATSGSSGSGGGGTSGTAGTGGVPPGGGVGDDCSKSAPCRIGLECVNDICEPGGTLDPGSPCTIQPECQQGLNCVFGTCGPAGDGGRGDACTSDADCAAGLRCAITGLSPSCVPQGTGDVGDDCMSSTNCYGGLVCANGMCAKPGLPMDWEGVECEPPVDEGEEVRAFFEVPGADGAVEGDFFRLPFPNDARRTGSRVDLSGFPTPGVGILGIDPVELYVDAIEANERAWGAYPTVYFRFSGLLDIDSLRNTMGSVNWIDVTPGTPELGQNRGLTWFSSYGRRTYICENWFGVRRPIGQPLLPGHTYAVWLSTGVVASGGGTIRRSANLISLLGNAVPTDPVLEPIHTLYAPFRAYLTSRNQNPATVLTATVFTVGNHTNTMEDLADAVAALAPPTATDWTLCDTDVESPCPDHDGERACGAGTADYDEYHALVSLPIYQEGTAPYLTPSDGGGIVISADPRREDVCLSLTVPTGTAPATGWPLVVSAHGTGGSFRSHVTPSVAGVLSSGTVKFAVLGIDQVVHGPRRGGSNESPENLFFNFLNPDAARGNPLQGAADQLSLLRFAATIDGTGDMPTSIDSAKLYFFGHSQGGTHGSLMLPYADDYGAAVLSGNGGSLMHSLLNKTSPVDLKVVLATLVQDRSILPDTNGNSTGELSVPLGLLQHWIDRADPLNFARLLTTPPMGRSMRHTFETYGMGDTYSPPITLDNYSVAGAFLQVQPSYYPTNGNPGLMSAPAPVAGNLGTNMITHGMRQYRPGSGDDGHFVVFDVPQANEDFVRFLTMAAEGDVPAIGE